MDSASTVSHKGISVSLQAVHTMSYLFGFVVIGALSVVLSVWPAAKTVGLAQVALARYSLAKEVSSALTHSQGKQKTENCGQSSRLDKCLPPSCVLAVSCQNPTLPVTSVGLRKAAHAVWFYHLRPAHQINTRFLANLPEIASFFSALNSLGRGFKLPLSV